MELKVKEMVLLLSQDEIEKLEQELHDAGFNDGSPTMRKDLSEVKDMDESYPNLMYLRTLLQKN